MMDKINYIGFYDLISYKNEERSCFLSAINKMNYVAEVFLDIDIKVKIISPAWTLKNKGYYKSRTNDINNKFQVEVCPTFGTRNGLTKLLKIAFSNLWLLKKLFIDIKFGETIIVYHSLGHMIPIIIAKWIKGFKIILQVEEIYQDAGEYHFIIRSLENYFLSIGDSYIFSNRILNETINKGEKHYIVLHGSYRAQNNIAKRSRTNIIHVVYSGIIDNVKRGAFNAVDAAQYLPNNYYMHILGFGKNIDIELLIELIKINNQKGDSVCQIKYEGILVGEKYNEFLQLCDIGLSTQMTNTSFSDTSFPSKVLSYLENGLQVVSNRTNSIINSDLNEYVYYYESDDPKQIANAILNVKFLNNSASRNIIVNLDKKFRLDLKKLLNIMKAEQNERL